MNERTDTERLDWLERNAPNDLLVQFHPATNKRSYAVAYKANGVWYTSLRAAIDGAMYIQSREQAPATTRNPSTGAGSRGN